MREVTVERTVPADVSGTGELAGVDNGDLDSDESWVGESRSAYHGRCIAVVQAGREAGEVTVDAVADGIEGEDAVIAVERPG